MEQHNTDILVIGAGLTGLTTAFRLTRGGKQVHILECSNRVGGQIHTFREDGFVFESGPNTGVISYPEVAELFEALSPACQLERKLFPCITFRLVQCNNNPVVYPR